MKIALIGTRGVPASYGGFETCVEEVGQRLAEKGHDVTVYCRKSYYKNKLDNYLGMKLIYLPNLRKKSLDTMSHTFLSVLHTLFKGYDVYMVFNAANSLFILPLRLLGKKIIINTDGLEWKRSKWGFWGRTYYKISEKLACLFATRLVSDSKGIKEYYKKTYDTDSTEIAYGAYVQHWKNPKRLSELRIKPHEYFLQITRFEPENNPLLTTKAFKRLNTTKKLVVVGGNPYPTEYTKQIRLEANGNIILPGFIYDQDLLKELWCLCFAYVHGNEVGGTNPALLQSMASGCFTIAIDVLFNRDALADCGIYFKKDIKSLAEKMQWALDNEEKLDEFKEKAQVSIFENYSWEKITDQYEQLFYEVINGKYPWHPKLSHLFHLFEFSSKS
jgi:glycosyltransferase involved in cell wall biosynthesis